METEIEWTDTLSVEDYLRLRTSTGWPAFPREQAQNGLDNAFKIVAAKIGGQTVAMGRLLWDGSYVAYLSDVIVLEEYRGRALGTTMVAKLITALKEQLKPGWRVKVSLMSALGRESFYEQFGFVRRPNEVGGAGMDQWFYCQGEESK